MFNETRPERLKRFHQMCKKYFDEDYTQEEAEEFLEGVLCMLQACQDFLESLSDEEYKQYKPLEWRLNNAALVNSQKNND
jgi:hypothetical protein